MRNTSRLKAGLIHFSLSLTIFSIAFFILFTLWYPEPFFTAGGGWQGLKIVASIDVALGPLLTTIIFSPGKSLRYLKYDLCVIALLQLSAFSWGIYTVYQQRPVAAVFYDDAFYTISASDLIAQGYQLAHLQQFSDNKPPLIYVQRPTDSEALKKSLALIVDKQIGPHIQTDLYQPLAKNFNKLAPAQFNIELLRHSSELLNKNLESFLSQSGLKQADLQFYLLRAKYQDMVLIFNQTGQLVGHLMLPNGLV